MTGGQAVSGLKMFGLKSSKDQNSSEKVYSYAALNYVFIRKITTQLCSFSMSQEENRCICLM